MGVSLTAEGGGKTLTSLYGTGGRKEDGSSGKGPWKLLQTKSQHFRLERAREDIPGLRSGGGQTLLSERKSLGQDRSRKKEKKK